MANTSTISNLPEEKACVPICPKLSYAIMLLGVFVLALSGIGTFLFGKPPMTHWTLMLHVGASPLFAIGLALVALTWPARCAMHSCVARFFFWLMLLCGLVVILSGVLPMTPLFGTECQHFLYLVHRYSGMVLSGLVALHALSLRSKS